MSQEHISIRGARTHNLKNIFMPFTVGGGIGDLIDIRDILNAGAEKISINTQAVKNYDWYTGKDA